MKESPTAISDWSVSLAPAENTGAEHTFAPVSRLKTTMSIGFALSVMPTRPSVVIVGVVPDPISVCPGFDIPSFGYGERRDDLVAARHRAGQVVVALELEPRLTARRLAHDEQVAGGGGDH